VDAWLELLSRELAMLALLTALGIGPVTFLHPSVDRASRLALAPAIGLAVAACALLTTLWRVPADKGWPILVVLVLASIALAVVKLRRTGPIGLSRLALPLRESLQLAVLLVALLVTLNLPLAQRDSAGPVGGYRVADTTGYVSEINGAVEQSIRAAAQQKPPWHDLSLQYWSSMAGHFQQIGYDAVIAHTSVLLGLGATDTHSPFLLALLLVGALAAWAVVRQVTATRSWAAVLAGLLFAGPFFRTLFMDGSEGAISGLVVVLPLALAGWWALRYRRWEDLVVLGLLAAGFQTLYPLFVPPVAIAAAAVLAILGVARLQRGGLTTPVVVRALLVVVGVTALAAALTPVAFERNLRYWTNILDGKFSFVGLPVYDLPIGVLPGWLLQSREFYFLPHLAGQSLWELGTSVGVPLVLLAVIGYGLWRHRAATAIVAVVAAAAALAYQTATANDCSYCAQRNLMVIAPIAMGLIGIGVAAMRAAGGRIALLSLAVCAMLVPAVAVKASSVIKRTSYGAYILDPGVEKVLNRLPHDGRPVEIEGFGLGALAPMEEPLAYNRADEVTSAPLSVAAETDPNRGLLYLGGPRPVGIGAEFQPAYRYVLSRVADVRTPNRRTLARSGPIALQERTGDLDVTLTAGAAVALGWQDPRGQAWVQPQAPLTLWVVGGPSGQDVWLHLALDAAGPTKAVGERLSARQNGRRLDVCMRLAGQPPLRRALATFTFAPVAAPPGPNEYALPQPPRGLRLTEMQASTQSCRSTTR
jgi:hypothetical protein